MQRVLSSGWYLLGKELHSFEQHYAEYIGSKYCVGVGNGLDALTLIYRAYIEQGIMHEGDEVIVPANTYIATILALTENGLVPILAEPRKDSLVIDDTQIESLITEKTRSLLIVHLYGRCAYTSAISQLCKKYNLLLVEDNAQAHGCHTADGRVTGCLGNAAAHSFYPGKNLGALGDAGAVTTDDASLAEIVRAISNYGSHKKYVFQYAGRNSRMDELQAAILNVKLRHLDEDNVKRRSIAATYYDSIHHPDIMLPLRRDDAENVYHIFPILCKQRNALRDYLNSTGVETLIHYPIPPHHQECYRQWRHLSLPVTEQIHNEELSLPISPVVSVEEARIVADLINSWNGK